jgi:hypothetical protein
MTRVRLVVEGPDDQHVIGHLLKTHGIVVPEPTVAGGIDLLLSELPTYLKVNPDDAHAIVVDADLDAPATWAALRARLRESGYPDVPPAPSPDGLIIPTAGRAPAGVWIMPDNRMPGTLEHFLQQLVPKEDAIWSRAQRAVGEIKAPNRSSSWIAKAEIHTWLAWQEEPGVRMGSAISKRYFATDSALAERFVAWIRRLQVLAS